jgi:hypothetical protein
MSNFVLDNFSNTQGVLLQNHTGDLGATWNKHPLSDMDFVFTNSGRVRGSLASGRACYLIQDAPLNAEYDVEADMTVLSVLSGNYCGVLARFDASVLTGYKIIYVPQAGTWLLYKMTNGSEESLASGNFLIPTGETRTIRFEVRNATKKLFIGATEILSSNDNSIITGRIGLYGGMVAGANSDSAGVQFDRFAGVNFGEPPPTKVSVPVNSAQIYWSKNWLVTASLAKTNNTGAYMKTKFTGTSVSVVFDVSSFVSNSVPSYQYPEVKWSVDNEVWQTLAITSTTAEVSLASSLLNGEHVIEFYVKGFYLDLDRWNTPINCVTISDIKIDQGSSLVSPTIRPKTALFLGDSIIESVNSVPGSGYSAAASDGTISIASLVSVGLNWEYAQRGFGSQSWFQNGTGNVPKPQLSYNLLWLGQSFNLSVFDYIISFYGTGVEQLVDPNDVKLWIEGVRSVAANATIFIILPTTTGNHSAIQTGYNNYVSLYPNDNKVELLGPLPNVEGMTTITQTSRFYTDTIHPNREGHARISTQICQLINEIINPGGGGGGINGTSIIGMI